jgi:putative endonuclease
MARSIIQWLQGGKRELRDAVQTRAERGAAGEALAERFLAARGIATVRRNFRCRGGEIDLIAVDGETLVFVEVRVRARNDFGGARASIDYHKQRRILRAAKFYLAGKPTRPCRFDVVVMSSSNGADIEWIRNAFDDEE